MRDMREQRDNRTVKNEKDEIDLLVLAKAVLDKWYLIAIAAFLGLVCAFLYARYCVTPTYQSRVSFFVYNNPNQTSQVGAINNSDLQATESLATTYSKILKSNTMLDAVLNNMGTAPGISRSALSGMVAASVVKDTQLLEVVITSTDPDTALAVALSFAETAPDEIVRITKAGSVEVVDRPELPTSRSSPRLAKLLMMGVFAGAMLAAAFIVIRSLLDKTIYIPYDITQNTSVSFLGKIPVITQKNDDNKLWLPEDRSLIRSESDGDKSKKDPLKTSGKERLLNAGSPFDVKEAYVKLRTSLMFCMTADNSRACRSFVVTSPNPSEGKSLTAANIAISFAMLGKSVLLIDADMRKPNQHRLWGLDVKTGLSDHLISLQSEEPVKIEELPLKVLCSGTVPPNPSELLSSEYMKNFIAGCSEKYDYIIIDTPPINTVADVQILSTYVDGIVMIARSGETTLDELTASIEASEVSDGNLCGVVLNNLSAKYMDYGYKSKYKYKYKYKKYNNSY